MPADENAELMEKVVDVVRENPLTFEDAEGTPVLVDAVLVTHWFDPADGGYWVAASKTRESSHSVITGMLHSVITKGGRFAP